MYCNLFGGIAIPAFAKITHVAFSGLRSATGLYLHIGLSAFIITWW